MNSTQECEQDISSEGLITSATCHETHLFKPFSKEQSGATTEVIQSLEFARELSATPSNQGEN